MYGLCPDFLFSVFEKAVSVSGSTVESTVILRGGVGVRGIPLII